MISSKNLCNEHADQATSSSCQTGTSDFKFSIDRCCIPTVPQDEQNSELYNLGIDIYEQSDFEKEILNQVDKAYEKFNAENLKDKSVDGIPEGIKNVVRKFQEAETVNIATNSNQISNISFGACELEETEMGKRIRMGEMTPFGTPVSQNAFEVNSLTNIERYLKTQIEADKKKRELKRTNDTTKKALNKVKITKKKQPFRNNMHYKKNTRKRIKLETLKSEISDPEKKSGIYSTQVTPYKESSCSEYCPSGSEISSDDDGIKKPSWMNQKKNKKKKHSHQGWNTDDSEWEHSDEKKFKRESKSVQRERDDGDIDQYLRRISLWEKTNNQYEIESQVKTLDGGFKIALVVWNRLLNYQKVGVQWLWELHQQRCGGILGDEMGLGKTIQVIAFLSGLSISKLTSRHGSFIGLGPVLIVSPTTVMHQWIKELHCWWPQFRAALMHESGNFNGKREDLVYEIVKSKGILVTSYVGCVQQIYTLTKYLWHYVILDEGHKIRNPDSQITKAVKQLNTPHRIILSGSPMQNNLRELWSLFDFIFPGKLGTLPVFMSEFSVPITQGGYTNASQVQVATAYKCAIVLRDTISPYLLRRLKDDVKHNINLPMKNEQVLFCKLTDEQRKLYLEYLESGEVDSILSGKYKIFVGLIKLRKICNHPHLFRGGPKFFKWDKTQSKPNEESYGYWKKAGKMIVVETLLKIWKRQNHRVLIFTQSKQMLHILERFVELQGYQYLKLDGSTSIGSRQPIIRSFNEDKNYFLFLSTTHVGGLGVNLTGADRVIIYDPDWNPATDVQARERAWRIGQTNQVTIYRLITSGTIEEKIYHRQIFKQFLTNKVLKDPKQRRFFKSNDLYELFTLKDTDCETETSALFAGSGSEVNLKQIAFRIKSRVKMSPKWKEDKSNIASILSKEKVERMKQQAKLLSQKISSGTFSASKVSDEPTKGVLKSNLPTDHYDKIPESTDSLGVKIYAPAFDNCAKDKSCKKKRKRACFATFEGETVPHLINKLDYKGSKNSQDEYRREQDDYILEKLFSKSGIKTAMQHDRIMEGPSDFALVEGEAEKVAKEAVRALKESRRQYFQNPDGPIISKKPRFGSKSRKNTFGGSTQNKHDENSKVMTSSELLSRMKERHRLLCFDDDTVTSITPTEYSREQMELLTDIRNFISFEAEVNNMASTDEIIERFQNRLPAGTSPLFRALLLEISEFHRNSKGKGIWRLRQDFRW